MPVDATRLLALRDRLLATPRRRRGWKIAGALLAAWLLLSALVWLFAPGLVRDYAITYVREEFGQELELAEVQVNPLALAVTLHELNLRDRSRRSLVAFRDLEVNVSLSTLVRGMVVLDEFRLDGLVVNIERIGADRFNFSELADRLAARAAAAAAAAPEPVAEVPASTEPPVHFLVARTTVSDAAFRFVDHTRTPVFENALRPINLAMEDLTSRPDREAPYSLQATIGSGGVIGWRGDLSLQPLRSQGRLELKGFGLKAVHDYMASQFAFALPAGTMDVGVDYLADFSGTQSVLRITDGSVSIDGLAITDPDGAPLFAFTSTRATGLVADLIQSTASVALVETLGGKVHLVRNADGSTNIERALLPPAVVAAVVDAEAPAAAKAEAAVAAPAPAKAAVPAPEPTAPAETPATIWNIVVAKASLRDYTLHVEDRSTTPAAAFTLTGVAFSAGNLRVPEPAPMPFTLDATLAAAPDGTGNAGTLAINGNYTLADGSLAAELKVVELALAPFSPYLGSVGRITLGDGRVNWAGKVAAQANGTQDLSVQGSGRLTRLLVLDDIHKTRLARLGELALDGLVYEDRFAGRAPRLALRKLTLAGLAVDVAVDRNGVLNLQQVLATGAPPATAAVPGPAAAGATPATAAPATATPAATPPLAIRLDSFVLRDTTVTIRDASPDLSFSGELSGFGGTITGLSTDPAKRAAVDLKGTINRYAPLTISGEINPLAAVTYSDLKVRLSSLDLSALTPYTVTYIAYPLERGKLGLELDWKIAARKFESQNRLLLDGLALGEKREAPRATKLPVKLGIALLTNREGDADLSVPAYGELDDPKFRIGKVVLAALGNLITRAATSPFALLGGGDNADAAGQVRYAAGSSTPGAGEADKLAKLAPALLERPQLVVQITGAASAVSDRAALQRAELELRLKQEYLASPFRRGQTVDQVVLSADQRQELLATLYQRSTGQRLADLAVPGAPPGGPAAAEAASAALLATISIDDGALRELARARAQQVKDRLLAAGLPEARLFVVDGEILPTAAPAGGIPTRLALDAP